MLFYNAELLNILERRVKRWALAGFYGGAFSPDRSKFFAYSYMRLDPSKADDYGHLYEGGHGVAGADFEKARVYLDEGGYKGKPVVDCIREGVYQAYAVCFSGAWWEGEWFILEGVVFFGEKMEEAAAKSYLGERIDAPDYWETMNFKMVLPDERTEFTEMPFLVSWIKSNRKTDIHSAYIEYMNVSLVDSFLEQLRIVRFEEYAEYGSTPWGRWGQFLIYPESKAYFLVVTLARHRELGWRLVWFFYDHAATKFYRWTYPRPDYHAARHWYAGEIIDAISDISGWDDYQFLNSSRTLDDPAFWSEYVLKRVDGHYRWLEEV